MRTWPFKDVFAILCTLNPDTKPETVAARIKQWQRLGIPKGVKVGRGVKCEYTDAMIWDMAIISAMQNMGIPPVNALEQMKHHDNLGRIATRHGSIIIDTNRIVSAIATQRQLSGNSG